MSQRVLAVGHDAGRHGAARVMLDVLDWFHRNSDLRFGVVLHMGGPLLDGFRRVARTAVLNPYLGSPKLTARVARTLIHNPRTLDRILGARLRRGVLLPQYDVVWMNSVASWKAVDAVAPRGVPRVLHVHELEGIIELVGPPGQSIAGLADRFVAVSRAVRENLVVHHGVDRRRITVVHSSVPERTTRTLSRDERTQERSRLGIGPRDVVLAACGMGTSAKGFDLVGRLFGALRRRRDLPPIRLIWVGRVDANVAASLRVDLERLGVSTALHLPGEVDDPRSLFALADVFVLPSREESLSLVALEAAQCGLPTVCFADAGGAPEFVEDDAGSVVPYLDVDAFAAAVAELALDAQLRERFGDRARAKVEERFSIGRQAPLLGEVFAEVGYGVAAT